MDPKGQVVSIGYGCEYKGIILHELMHTVGFFHTNSRPDRDAYVIVYTKNIRPGEWCICYRSVVLGIYTKQNQIEELKSLRPQIGLVHKRSEALYNSNLTNHFTPVANQNMPG